MTTAAYVSSATGAATTTVTKPASVTTGDHLFVFTFEGNVTLTLSGSTFLSLGDFLVQDGGGGGTNAVHAFYRAIDGTESSSFTASASCNYVAIAYRGGSGPPALIGGTARTTSGTGPDSNIPGRYIAPAAGLVVNVFAGGSSNGAGGGIVTTAPAGVTSRATASSASFWSMNVSDEAATAGQDQSRTATTDRNNSGLHLAFMIPDAGTIPAAIGGNIYNSGNSANATITVPSYAQAGDLFIVGYEVTANTITAGPTGFTAVDGPGTFTGGTYSSNYWWGYKVLVSGDVSAAKAVTSGSQIWAAVGILIRNPASTPVKATGTMTHGTSTTPSLVSVTSSSAASVAVSAFLASQAGGGAAIGLLNPATTKGVIARATGITNSGYGTALLAVHGVASGGSSIAPPMAIGSSPTWETNTILLNLPSSGPSPGDAAKTVTIATTSTGVRGKLGAAARTVTVAATSALRLGVSAAGSKTLSVAATSAGVRGKVAAAAAVLSVAATATGVVNAAAVGTAGKTVTISATSAAHLGRSGAAGKSITVAATSGGTRGKLGGVARTVTVGTASVGRRGKVAAASAPLALSVTAVGSVGVGGNSVTYWNGTAPAAATVLGWWDGTTTQPATVLGWWDGTTTQTLA